MTKVKLLLADNSEIFREGLVKLLKHEPSIEVVCTCRTGLEAVETANKHQLDVILIDIELSECSGIEAIQRIHERLPRTSIIVLTHSEVNGDLLSAVKAGAKAYLSKDISIKNLIDAITFVAEGGAIVSSPMASKLFAQFKSLEELAGAAELGSITPLTKREHVVLCSVAQGLTNSEIATTLSISEHTVKVHLHNIMGKLHAHTRQQAVVLTKGQLLSPASDDH